MMETASDPFAQLDDIDWQTAFTDALHDTVTAEADPDTLRERLETFVQNAGAMAEMQTFQALAAAMGDICCSNPTVQMAVESSETLRALFDTDDCKEKCNDDHGEDETDDDDDDDPRSKRRKPSSIRWF